MSVFEHRGGLVPAARLLTPRSIGIGVGSGVLVAVAFGQIYSVAWAAAYVLGGVVAALEHLDGDVSVPADPRLHRVTPPPGGGALS